MTHSVFCHGGSSISNVLLWAAEDIRYINAKLLSMLKVISIYETMHRQLAASLLYSPRRVQPYIASHGFAKSNRRDIDFDGHSKLAYQLPLLIDDLCAKYATKLLHDTPSIYSRRRLLFIGARRKITRRFNFSFKIISFSLISALTTYNTYMYSLGPLLPEL